MFSIDSQVAVGPRPMLAACETVGSRAETICNRLRPNDSKIRPSRLAVRSQQMPDADLYRRIRSILPWVEMTNATGQGHDGVASPYGGLRRRRSWQHDSANASTEDAATMRCIPGLDSWHAHCKVCIRPASKLLQKCLRINCPGIDIGVLAN